MTSSPLYRRFAGLAAASIAVLYLGSLYFCRHGVIADGYDGIGFVLSLHNFDLTRFQPQPPGYPLYVGTGRLLGHLNLRPALALAVPNALLLAAGLGALAGLLREKFGPAAGVFFLLLCPTAPLVFGLGMATLSDGAGLGVLLLSMVTAVRATQFASSSRFAHGLAGALGGLSLGFRPPLLPLLLLIFFAIYGKAWRRQLVNRRTLAVLGGAFCAAVLMWLLPLGLIVGPRQLVHLTMAHGRGHFTDFGGSALHDPQPLLRLHAFLNGLYQGSLGRLGGLLLLPLLQIRRSPAMRGGGLILGLYGLYSVFIIATMPVAGHGRHLLPLAVALSTLLALGLSFVISRQQPSRLPLVRISLLLLAALIGLQNGQTAWNFRRTPAPGAALGAQVAQNFAEARLYGAGAARYLDLYRGSGAAHPAVYLGEVLADLERLDRLPAFVLLTSEVLIAPASRGRLQTLGRYCYADGIPTVLRFDRAALGRGAQRSPEECLHLLAYRVRP